MSVEEIAVSSTAQIHKLEVILEELDKRLGQEDGGGLKWNVKRESCGRLNQGSNSWRVPIIHEGFEYDAKSVGDLWFDALKEADFQLCSLKRSNFGMMLHLLNTVMRFLSVAPQPKLRSSC